MISGERLVVVLGLAGACCRLHLALAKRAALQLSQHAPPLLGLGLLALHRQLQGRNWRDIRMGEQGQRCACLVLRL